MNYGIPYKGSKSKIANKILNALPSGDVFVDLFAGGCAITHAAILSGKYNKFIVNDIQGMFPKYFNDLITGRAPKERRVISKEQFDKYKHIDPYVSICWSFGNNCKDYLWGENIYKQKILACKIIMAETQYERRIFYRKFIQSLQSLERLERLQSLQSLQSLESLERLERLQSLQSLERFKNIKISSLSYDKVDIPDDSVIYCDPPYINTNKYNDGGFDHDRFYDWLRNIGRVVYVSEYTMPSDFIPILSISKNCNYSASLNAKKTVENLYVHDSHIESIKKNTLF